MQRSHSIGTDGRSGEPQQRFRCQGWREDDCGMPQVVLVVPIIDTVQSPYVKLARLNVEE